MAYDGAWEQHLIDFHFYPPHNHLTQTPANLDNIKARLSRRRPSLDQPRFSDDDYSEFKKNNADVKSKIAAQTLVFSTLVGKLDIPHEQGMTFSNLEPLTDDTIPMPRPEFYDGLHPSRIECGLREELAGLIMPSKNPSAAILPTFLMTVAGKEVAHTKLMRAAWYYGVLAARGVYQLRCRIPLQTLNDKRAYVITADYNPGSLLLNLYVTHMVLTSNPAAPVQYHTNTCGSWLLGNDAEAFRTAVSALRNAREWAREQREDLIRVTNGMAMRFFVMIP